MSNLELTESAISAATFRNYYYGIKALERFTYNADIRNGFAYPNGIWEPCGIVAALRQYASKNLVHLEITQSVTPDREAAEPNFDNGEPYIVAYAISRSWRRFVWRRQFFSTKSKTMIHLARR